MINNNVYLIEEWKPIKGYEGLYEISNMGNVKSLEKQIKNQYGGIRCANEIIMKQKDIRGYKNITLSKNGKSKMHQVHRLVTLHFNPIDNPENYQVNHIDCVKDNNIINNLEWVSPQENTLHAHRNGMCRDQDGENNSSAKLTNKNVLDIVNLYNTSGLSHSKLGLMYEVNRRTIGDIINGKTWSSVTGIKRCND